MKVRIVGAGAIGGLTGAFLVRAGVEVHFTDVVHEHIDSINSQGLHIDGIEGEFTVRVTASTAEEASDRPDVVMLAVKSQHTDQALRDLLPHLNENTLVVSLQNGLNLESIAQVVGNQNTAGTMLNISADYIAPGHIRYGGAGDYFMGMIDKRLDPRLAWLAQRLETQSRTQLTTNIHGYLWSKECYGCLLVATALGDDPIHEVAAIPYKQDIISAALQEAVLIADVAGVALEPYYPFSPDDFREHASASQRQAFFERVINRYKHQIKQHSGIWRDLRVRRRKSEVYWLTGELVRRAESVGLECPINRRIVEMVGEIEAGERTTSEGNFLELDAMLREGSNMDID